MKRIISNVMLFAAAAMAFVSCQKQEMSAPEISQDLVLTFESEKPAFADETKTEWTGTDIQWSKGDKIAVAYTVDGNWQNASGNASGDAKLYKSDELAASGFTAQFNVSTYFKGSVEGTHVFYGVYPAPSGTGFADAPVATINVSTIQNPKADSFDANADLMVGVSDELGARPSEEDKISLQWSRLVAHAVITLKDISGFTADESIEYITLTAQDGANLVGQQKVNLITKEIVKDNSEANVLKVSADKLAVNNGSVTFWACFLPETLTSITVKVETNVATYTREITGISKTFKQNARNILSIKMNDATRVVNEADPYTVDVLNREVTGVAAATTYVDWNGKTLMSGAVYAGQSAGDKNSIQLRSKNNNSGVITTTSGGYARKVSVKWNSNTASGRTLDVYGKSTSYTSPTELYNEETSGVLIGKIVCGTSNELVIEDDYQFVGLRSSDGAMYLDEISVSWEAGAPDPTAPKLTLKKTSIELSASKSEGTIEFVSENVEELEVSAFADANFSEFCDWLEVELGDGVVSYVVQENEGAARTAYIRINGFDTKGEFFASSPVVVTQAAAESASTYASLTDLVGDGAPTTTARKVTVTLKDEVITGIYTTSSGYRNGVFLQVGEQEIEIFSYDVPSEWEIGGTISGTLKECDWKLYKEIWELCPADWSELTYTAPEGGSTEPEPENPEVKVVTAAEFNAATDNSIEYQVSGTISGIYQAYNADYNNISLYISDETGEMLAYRLSCEGIADPANTLTKGDLITVKGKRTLYETNPQMGQGGVIVEHTDVVVVAPVGSVSLSFADKANRTTCTTSQQVWEQNGIKLINDKGSSTSSVGDYANPARFYKSSTITVEYPGMTKIEFTCNSTSYANALKSSITTGTVSVSGSVVTVKLEEAADSYMISSLTGGQVRMDSITVFAN